MGLPVAEPLQPPSASASLSASPARCKLSSLPWQICDQATTTVTTWAGDDRCPPRFRSPPLCPPPPGNTCSKLWTVSWNYLGFNGVHHVAMYRTKWSAETLFTQASSTEIRFHIRCGNCNCNCLHVTPPARVSRQSTVDSRVRPSQASRSAVGDLDELYWPYWLLLYWSLVADSEQMVEACNTLSWMLHTHSSNRVIRFSGCIALWWWAARADRWHGFTRCSLALSVSAVFKVFTQFGKLLHLFGNINILLGIKRKSKNMYVY